MKYYELTPHELKKVQDDRDEGALFFGIAALFLGIAVDTLRDLLMSEKISAENKGVVVTAFALCSVVAVSCAIYGVIKRRRAKTYLQDIKDEHDFNE